MEILSTSKTPQIAEVTTGQLHTASDFRSTSPEAIALAKALKKRGFRFFGPTTAYAAMQACGLVNDHLPTCEFYLQ